MPLQECDSEELQEALRLYRRASDRSQNALAELRLFLRELTEAREALKDRESLKNAGTVLELGGQLVGVMTKPSAAGVMELLGKAITEGSELLHKDVLEGYLAANQAERLRILQEALRLDLEDEVDRREAARGLVDAYWACTERLAPRRIRFVLTGQGEGGFLGVRMRSEVRFEGEAELRPQSADEPVGRPWRCLTDPELAEVYDAEGEVTVTVPCYEWTSTGSGVQVRGVSHELGGGPLRFHTGVRWLRGRPSTLSISPLWFKGQLTLHVEGVVEAFGQGQSFASDENPALFAGKALYRLMQIRAVEVEAAPGEPWRTTLTECEESVRSALELTVSR